LGSLRDFVQVFVQKKIYNPWRYPLKRRSILSKNKVVEHTMNDLQGSLGITPSRIFLVIFVTSSEIYTWGQWKVESI
jgi:hypothetical protein